MTLDRPPIRQMIKDAVEELGGRATHKQIINLINEKFDGVNQNTIRAQLNACTVNMPGRVGMPENDHPRENDPRYDYLYSIDRGEVEFYEPKIHGRWTIMRDENGKTTVAKDGKPITNSSSNLDESLLLKFVRDEMKMQANYQPIVIKMLLESGSFEQIFGSSIVRKDTTIKQAAIIILQQKGAPLHYKDITKMALEQNLFKTEGETPEASLLAEMTKDIAANGKNAIFKKIDEGYYGLNDYTSKSDQSFSVTIKEIREKFDELNFGTDTQSSISSVKGTLSERGLVTFTGTGDYDTAEFVDGAINVSEIPEILKICGQEIVRWHINKIVKNEKLGIWRVLPGSTESDFALEKEFRESNSIGVGYWLDNVDLTNLTQDEVKKECDRISTMKDPQKKQATPAMKGSVTAITHKITPKDIVILTRGEKEVIDFGIVTSKYFFNEVGEASYSQRRKVVWLNQGPISKTVLPFISEGPSSAIWQFNEEAEEKIIEYLLGEKTKQSQYFLLRHKPDGPYGDTTGKKYHFSKNVPNYKKLLKYGIGLKAIWDHTQDKGTYYFWGYGTGKEIETLKKNEEWNLIFDNFTFFDKEEDSIELDERFLKLGSKSIQQQIKYLEDNSKTTGYNYQHSPRPITKKIYEEITGDRSGMESSELSNTLNVEPFKHALKWKPNLVLYGPPGTGKTFHANEIAKSIVGDDSDLIAKVTFHPSYSYEDFVEGYRPVVEDESSKQYELKKGIFWETCEKAKEHPDKKVILIIDEINRGNIPKIFGELITLIEKDKRKEEHALKLAYSQKQFFVPENLLIIGTMNTADKSLMQMDDALKRRFVFEELMPDTKALLNNFRENGVPERRNYTKILEKINEKIIGKGEDDEKQKKIQFRDRQIGQSYFWNVKNDGDLQDVIKYDIIPLLQDYFYGDYDEIRKVLGEKIIGDGNRPTSLVTQRNKARNLKDELLEI